MKLMRIMIVVMILVVKNKTGDNVGSEHSYSGEVTSDDVRSDGNDSDDGVGSYENACSRYIRYILVLLL